MRAACWFARSQKVTLETIAAKQQSLANGQTPQEHLLDDMPKKYQVIKATTREIPGLKVGGRVKKFAPNGTFETTDAGEAKEIDKVLGAKGTGEVVVTPYEDKEQGHTYTFGASPRFSSAWDEFEKRRKDKAERDGKNPKKRVRRAKKPEVTNGSNSQQSDGARLA